MIDIKKLFISNKKGEKSATLTAFCYGFIIVCTKLILSGVEIGPVKLSDFSGVDFAAAVTALGGVYVLNKNHRKKDDTPPNSSGE